MSDIDDTADVLQYQYAKYGSKAPYVRVYTHKENPLIPLGSRVVVHVVVEDWLAQTVRPKRKVAEREMVTI